MGLHYWQKPAEGQGENNLIMNEPIRLSPDLTYSHNGKRAVTRKFLPGKASETQRLVCYKLHPFVLEARLSWNLLICKVKEGRVETGEKCPAVIVHTCGWGWRRRWEVPPPGPTISSIWPSGWPGETFQTSPRATSASSLCGIRDIPARMRSKGDSSAQGYHRPGVCPTQLFHEALLAQIKPPTPLSTWKILEE